MTEKTQTPTTSRYESIRIPILRASEYPIWKVKMEMFLEATDPEYLDRIHDGPHKPTKFSVAIGEEEQKMIPKEKKDYSPEDISSISKDAKVRHLLHNALDNVMSNRIIGCKTAKEIWDALEVRCQGTKAIKKNRRTILTQEYEHFDSNTDESLTDIYDRFLKLLNDLSLVDKEYNLEDSNLKFLLALPEKWDLKATTIRANHDLEDMSLDEIYGMLKTHELEMEQRSKRHGGKSKLIALKADEKASKEVTVKKSQSKGKALITKSDTESSNSDDDTNSDNLTDSDNDGSDAEMMQLAALMVRNFKKMAYKNFKKGKKFTRRDSDFQKKNFRKAEGKEGRSGKVDKSKITCYNCGEKGHFAPECKKAKTDKSQAYITKKKDWADTSDSEDEVNYALMANADSISKATETKVPHSTLAFDTTDICKLRLFLKNLHVSYRDQTLENERIKSESLDLRKRNNYLESELVQMLEIQKERDDAIIVKTELLKKHAYLESELAKETNIIKTWTNSGKNTQKIIENDCWKQGLGYTDKKKTANLEAETSKSVFTEKAAKPKVNHMRFVPKSDKPKQDKVKSVNISLMSQKQPNHKRKELKRVNKVKEPRKNRNGKVGINKSNNYIPIPNAPRKKCHNCGNPNHLANFCRKNINSIPSKLGVKNRSKPQNHCFHCGSIWHSIYTCKEYHNLYYNYYELKPSLNKFKIDSTCINSDKKYVSTNSDKTSAVKANKLNKAKGSKKVWVLKTNH